MTSIKIILIKDPLPNKGENFVLITVLYEYVYCIFTAILMSNAYGPFGPVIEIEISSTCQAFET